jgi:superfamily II DNA or RNA helicase
MTLRDKRQQEFADVWLNHGKFGILNLCPRFGKIRTTINILKKLKPKHVLIAYPDNKIKESWQDDFRACNYTDSFITYTTHLSIKKYLEDQFDLIVIDEIHLLSEAQMEATKEMIDKHLEFSHMGGHVLGLTGTMTEWTKRTLFEQLELSVVAEYPIEQAIKEGVIVDYEIFVKTVPLDRRTLQNYKGKNRTEKQQFEAITWAINTTEQRGGNTMFLRLARMRIIQNSLAKRECTKRILEKHKDERILVFCGVTKIADALGIPSYHSKKGEKEMFEKFVSGEGSNHMAVVKIGNTGVTYKPLNKVIINYFDSNAENLAQKINRCMAMEYDTPDKKAQIYIVCTDETVEKNWLRKALQFFEKDKIKYV